MEQIVIHEVDFQKARKKIREAQKKGLEIVFTSSDDELNRKILEKEKIDVLLLKLVRRKDRMKQRDSGFNQVLAKVAKKKGVAIGINLSEVIGSGGKEKAEILARIEQNIKLCNKNKIKTRFFSEKREIRDLKALGLVLGMPTWMTKSL